MFFIKVVPRPVGVHKQVVLGYFEMFSTHISACQSPKILERGLLRTKKGSKGGQNHIFPKVTRDHLIHYKQVVLSHVSTIFACPNVTTA